MFHTCLMNWFDHNVTLQASWHSSDGFSAHRGEPSTAGRCFSRHSFLRCKYVQAIKTHRISLTTYIIIVIVVKHQLLLIFQINTRYLHLNNYFFALGDDVITSYISGIQFLPLCLMYVQLCPHGSEGASYAMLITFGNIAMNCASTIG